MELPRRELLQKSRWALALPLLTGLPRRLRAEQISDLSQLESNITDHFKGLGYKSLPPLNLITGDAFNGGLRFDESFEGDYPAGNSMRIQNCARVDDLSLEGEAGVLAYFHIFILNQQTPTYQGELFSQLLGYLIDDIGLDAKKLVVVSTDKFLPYLPQLKKHGIDAAQLVERSHKEARASGDGSGYFAPKGHPHVSGYGDRTYKLHSDTTSEYGRYVKYPGVPVAGRFQGARSAGAALQSPRPFTRRAVGARAPSGHRGVLIPELRPAPIG